MLKIINAPRKTMESGAPRKTMDSRNQQIVVEYSTASYVFMFYFAKSLRSSHLFSPGKDFGLWTKK